MFVYTATEGASARLAIKEHPGPEWRLVTIHGQRIEAYNGESWTLFAHAVWERRLASREGK